ncbi:COR domain-containing protein [Desulfococcaceae bacterium HSG8]|nr:COR domain-containing protein [Desulfococcaceae bacterium HSG8]
MTPRELSEVIRKAEKEKTAKLDLSKCGITELPGEIGRLRSLTQLYLSSNQLKELPREIFRLRKLSILYLSGNQLEELPKEIFQLKNLSILNLSYNQLTELPSQIVQLKNLTILYLSNNQLKKLPPEIVHLKKLKVLDLDHNPLTFPPVEIVNQGLPVIRDYLKKSDRGGQLLYEGKLMIMGQGGVGKTCIMERLILNKYTEKQPVTEGIRIQPWELNAPDDAGTTMTLNVWDFGGQEIYHATHQFFLTKYSLYMLVWDARQEEEHERIDYWLNIISTFAEDSPVLIVMNKSDERAKDLGFSDLKRRYPRIIKSVKISAKEGSGIGTLEELVRNQAWELPLMGTFWPSSWLSVRRTLERASRDHIPYKNYLELCKRAGIEEKEARTLSRYLHDLGIILHFHNDLLLKDTIILRPKWGTDAVYKVLDSDHVHLGNGILYEKDLPDIWEDRKLYPPDSYKLILRLMVNFEQAFPFGKGDRYAVAEFLNPSEPRYDWNPEDALRFEYHYAFLPAGVVSRLIVRMYEFLILLDGKPVCWSKGAYFKYRESEAKIRIDQRSRTAVIRVRGIGKREFLSVIRSHFDALHKSINKIRVAEKVPCICCHECEHRFDYRVLSEFERKNKPTITCESSIEDVSVAGLLNSIENSEIRREKMEKRYLHGGMNDSQTRPRKWYQKIFSLKRGA